MEKKLRRKTLKNYYINRFAALFLVVPIFASLLLISSLTLTAFKTHAVPSVPDPAGHTRCGVLGPGADFDLRAVLHDAYIDLTTPIGEVLTTIEMEGGTWHFDCALTGDPDDIFHLGAHAWGGWSVAPSPNSDRTVCAIPGITGIGIRTYTRAGTANKCATTIFGDNNIVRIDDMHSFGSASYSPYAELVRIGDIEPGYHVLPSMQLTTMIADRSLRHDIFSLVFTNPTLEAHLCTMPGFNQIIDFGGAIARGDEVISKPFDIWLTDCSGAALTEYKNTAQLSFTSSPGRISADGTRLHNCDDSDCADGAYITFTDIEGDNINLHDGYRLNAQTTGNDYRLSFSSNLHTESTTAGKIDTSLTLVISFL